MIRNRRHFVNGEKLKVISDKDKFINLQDKCRGYSSIRMNHLPGSYVTVEHFSPTEVLVKKDNLEYYLHPETLEIYTSLFDAVTKGEEEKLRKLLHGENVNVQNEFGQTPIHLACYLGHINIVKLLLKFNPNFYIPDNKGNLPIHTTVDLKHYDIINYLRENVPDILEAKNSKGQSVQDIAENKNDEQLNNIILINLQTIPFPSKQCQPILVREPQNSENESMEPSTLRTLSMPSKECQMILVREPQNSENESMEPSTLQTISMPSKQYQMEASENHEYIPEELTCAICKDRMKTTILECGHMFCRECSRRLPLCPMCRKVTKVFAELK